MRRSIMQQPSVHSKVGKVSNPSDKQSDSTSCIPLWQSGVSDKVESPVDLVKRKKENNNKNMLFLTTKLY